MCVLYFVSLVVVSQVDSCPSFKWSSLHHLSETLQTLQCHRSVKTLAEILEDSTKYLPWSSLLTLDLRDNRIQQTTPHLVCCDT